MQIMRLVILSILHISLLNINDGYTMNKRNTQQNISSIIKVNQDNDLKIYNDNIQQSQKQVTKNGVLHTVTLGSNMCSLVSLTHLLSITNGDSLLNYPRYYSELLNKTQCYYPDCIFDFVVQKNGIKISSTNEIAQFWESSEDITQRLRVFLAMVSKQNLGFNKNLSIPEKVNPILEIIPNEELPMDYHINTNMDANTLAINMEATLKNYMMYSPDTINGIQNMFVDIDNINNLKYLYNAICYGDCNIKIGDNTFELVGVALLTHNKNGSKKDIGSHYMTAKKRSSGKWTVIDSLSNQNGRAIYNEYGTDNDLDDIITRLDNLNKGYILLPKLLLFRKINTKHKKQYNKVLNKEILQKINEKNDELFYILNQIDVLNMLKHINEYLKPLKDNKTLNSNSKTAVRNIESLFINKDRFPNLEYYIDQFLLTIKNSTITNQINKYYELFLQQCSMTYGWELFINMLPEKGEQKINNIDALYKHLIQYYKQLYTEKERLKSQVFDNNANPNKIDNIDLTNNKRDIPSKYIDIPYPYKKKKVKNIGMINHTSSPYSDEKYVAEPNKIINNNIQSKIINSSNKIKLVNNKIDELIDKQISLQNAIQEIKQELQANYITCIKNSYDMQTIKKMALQFANNNPNQLYKILKQNFMDYLNTLYEDYRNFVLSNEPDIVMVNDVFENMATVNNKPLIYAPYGSSTKDLPVQSVSSLQQVSTLFKKKQELEELEMQIDNLFQ